MQLPKPPPLVLLLLLGPLALSAVAPAPRRPLLTFGDHRVALEAIFGVGLRSSALLGDPSTSGNVIVSPVSITLLLGQLMLAAEGGTLDNLASLLSLKESPYDHVVNRKTGRRFALKHATFHVQMVALMGRLARAVGNYTLRQNSAVFYDEGLKLVEQFRYLAEEFYDAQITPVNFTADPSGSVQQVNKWAEEHTRGLIKTILQQAPRQPNAAIFANALYFLAEWETPFSNELNKLGEFSVSETKKVEVTYMLGFLEDLRYAETEQYKLVCLPYKNEEVGMYILLPKKEEDFYNIKRFQLKLNESELIETVAAAERHEVVVRLPKMQLTSTLSILRPLQKYAAFKKHFPTTVTFGDPMALQQLEHLIGEYIRFSAPEAGDVTLTRGAENSPLVVSDVVQQLTLSVNEKGTEAAAVTAGIVDYIGGSKTFVVDRPFVFFVWHESTKVLLFWGAVSDPTQSSQL